MNDALVVVVDSDEEAVKTLVQLAEDASFEVLSAESVEELEAAVLASQMAGGGVRVLRR
ncbi:MAG: hypothetical protein U5Q16_08030 [Gammaproteobacteria bacterium]|nr:hypothetical protein [Gammaproteobacteria bacterium]